MRKIKLGAIALALTLTTALPINVPYTAGLIGAPGAQAGVWGLSRAPPRSSAVPLRMSARFTRTLPPIRPDTPSERHRRLGVSSAVPRRLLAEMQSCGASMPQLVPEKSAKLLAKASLKDLSQSRSRSPASMVGLIRPALVPTSTRTCRDRRTAGPAPGAATLAGRRSRVSIADDPRTAIDHLEALRRYQTIVTSRASPFQEKLKTMTLHLTQGGTAGE